MIIGNGMLAKAFDFFTNRQDIVVFASGVSNSKNKDLSNFERESNLLKNTIQNNHDKLLVYFSTCSIEDKSQQNSHYIIHKRAMENLIQTKCNKYFIFRLPQVVGKTNSPTLVNFLKNVIENEISFEIQKNATRNLIHVDDVFLICKKIIENDLYQNEVINIASPYNIKVIEIVQILENVLNKKAKYLFIEAGASQIINIDKIKHIGVDIFNSDYLKDILIKGKSDE